MILYYTFQIDKSSIDWENILYVVIKTNIGLSKTNKVRSINVLLP